METIRIGMMGAGTVGGGLVELLPQHQERFKALDVKVELAKVLVRDEKKARPGIPSRLLSSKPANFLNDIDVLVEVAGGTDRAGEMVIEALEQGIPVVTANKALLAERWDELRPYAEEGALRGQRDGGHPHHRGLAEPVGQPNLGDARHCQRHVQLHHPAA
jgi:homoserine dehydrogenase